MNFIMKSKTCDLCGSTSFKRIPNSQMTECLECTIQYPNEAPTSGVVTNQAPVSPSGRGTLLSRSQARLARKFCNRPYLVDIGCGNGAFLHAFGQLQQNDCKMLGVELDDRSARAAQDSGIEVLREIPTDLDKTMISMWHVAEHFPVNILKQELTKLSQGDNLLLMSVPNGESYSWRKYKEKFSFYDQKSHLVQFTPRSLTQLLQESGWNIQMEFRTPVYGIFNAIQTGLNINRPHNEIYELIKREGNSLSFSVFLGNLSALIRAIIPISVMAILELSKKRGASFTLLATTKAS